MKQRRLGKNGPMVSMIGLGCMGMFYAYGQPNDPERARIPTMTDENAAAIMREQ
jgi:aryl-alcohol dehydrogenase-like predicted oxidoreductase